MLSKIIFRIIDIFYCHTFFPTKSGQADLEVPQIWVFAKYLNLLVILNRKNYDE